MAPRNKLTSAVVKMEAANIQEKLTQEGWNLSPSGVDQATENGKVSDIKTILRKLLDIDLRTISQGSLPDDINKTKYENIPGGIVLQIQKVKNLSSPKYQENVNPTANASIIKFVLTDGVQNVQGVAMQTIPSLHMNTLPGSKIMLTGEVEIAHCFLLLTLENTSFIGGRVEQLIEKWELNRKLAKHKRDSQEEGGPPPWIPFGQKIANLIVTDKNFKSLDQGKNKDITENTEFEAQRKGAILEASKIGAPKVFGGGNNKLLDHNVQVIVDAGFSVEQAEYALKVCKNNTDRALRSLQSKVTKPNKEDGGGGGNSKGGKPDDKTGGGGGGGKGGKGRGRHRDEEGGSSLKPSGKVSLFDFLEDKLPVQEKDLMNPPMDSRNNFYDKKPNKPMKPGGDKPKSFGDERKVFGERSDGRNSNRRPDGPKVIPKYDANDKKMRQQPEVIKFDGKRSYDPARNDKSFGNFKVKNEFMGSKQTDSGKTNRVVEKREPRPGQTQGKSYYNRNEKSYEPPEETSRKPSSFVPTNEKPPRFQKFQQNQNQNNENQAPHWSDSYSRLPPQQSDFQLQINLTLQRNIANYANHNSHDQLVPGVAPNNGNKNVFYGNMGTTDTHRPPPAAQPVPPVPAAAFPARNPAGFIQPDLKNSAYPGLPSVPDFPFKGSGAMMPGFNDFQAMFGNSGRATNSAYPTNNFNNLANNYSTPPNTYNNAQTNYNNTPAAFNSAPPAFNNTQPPSYNNAQSTPSNFNNYTTAPPFLSAPQLLQAPPPAPPPVQAPPPPAAQQPTRFTWKKGQKCYARYWEDQMYYNAVVTGVSESTCVVRFTDYGNYEEVLQNDCVPIQEMPPES